MLVAEEMLRNNRFFKRTLNVINDVTGGHVDIYGLPLNAWKRSFIQVLMTTTRTDIATIKKSIIV